MSETITVIGNITEPEFKVTGTGVPIVNFRIASTERRFDKTEEKWVDGATNWYSVSAFRRLAEHASRSFRKGDRILVTGRLRLRDWETSVKKGVTAEIDADALGHDLLWGTTTFHRGGGSSSSPDPQPAPSAWAVPGTEGAGASTSAPDAEANWPTIRPGASEEDDEDAVVADDAERPVLAAVGADTPF